jgi:hypothetical protein
VIAAVLGLVVVLLLFALGVALADRVLAALAERKASEYLSAPFAGAATVRLHGAPFLTQALRGRYREVEVSGGGLQVGEISGAVLHARLRNIHLPARELLAGGTAELPCEHVEGRLVLPYGEVARVSHLPGLSLAYERERLVASASLPVPGISQLARVSGDAQLAVVDGVLWLRLSGVAVAGLSLTAPVIKQLLPRLTVPIGLPALPWGLRLGRIEAIESGLVVYGSADAVVFRRPADR